MRRLAAALAIAFSSADLFAVRHVGFEVDLFNRAFPIESCTNVVFSPLSVEMDCALTAEAMDTLARAGVAETMGVLVDFGGVYRPIRESFAAREGEVGFVSARGFCVPDLRLAKPEFRNQIQREYGAEVMPAFPSRGAECWFRATMDGTMEDFRIPVEVSTSGRYSFFDLLTFDVAWKDPFPTANSRKLEFKCIDGSKRKIDFMSDVRIVDTWDAREYVLLKMPLKGGLDFYAMQPKDGLKLNVVRSDFSSMEIDFLLLITGQMDSRGVRRGSAVVVLPRLEFRSQTEFSSVMRDFRIPTSSLVRLTGSVAPRTYEQRVRFRLAEHGVNEPPLAQKPVERQVRITEDTKRLMFNRPFLFFVHDGETGTIPVAGIFTGLD